MKKQQLIEFTEKLAEEICREKGYELVDVDFVKEGSNDYLRILADKQGGFSINDCVELSRAVEEKLDAADTGEDAYILEVSSPGLDRPLKKDKDFQREAGKLVEVKLYKPLGKACEALSECTDASLDLRAKELTALLTGYDAEKKLVTLESEEGTAFSLERKELALIRLAVIF